MEDNKKNNITSLIEIPDGVVNEKEWRKYLLLKNNPVMRNTIYIASNGKEINIAMLPHLLRKKIEDLSPKEQEEILNKKAQWQHLRAKISVAHATAFGRAGCFGKNKGFKGARLSPFENDIVELLGRLFTIDEVIRIMGEDNGIEITREDVQDVIRKFAVEIEKKRDEFRNKLVDVRLYNKRPRLEELAWLYNKMKYRFIAYNGIDAYNCLLRTLEQIRKEAEGDILNIRGALDVNIEVAIQEHLQAEILRTINLKEVILGRVAARMNYDLKKLVAGLHNSYYAKFVEISGDLDEDAVMEYPSASAYDFTEIERTAKDDKMEVQVEEVSKEDKEKATNIKNIFLQKLREQKKRQESRTTAFDLRAQDEKTEPTPELSKLDRTKFNGRWADEKLPSQTPKGKRKNVDYYSGEKK